MSKMDSVIATIISADGDSNLEKIFSDFYSLEEIDGPEKMLEIVDTLAFKDKEFKLKLIDTIEGFKDYSIFSLIEDLSKDLNIWISKKDRLSIFNFNSIQKTSERLSQTADWAVFRSYKRNPNWNILAGRIKLQELYLNSVSKFSDLPKQIPKWFSEESKEYIARHSADLDSIIVPERDLQYNYMSLSTLIKSYLIKKNEKLILETPQMMLLRTAVQQYMNYYDDNTEENYQKELSMIKKVYDDLSNMKYVHASPTLFNSLSRKPGLSSCFLIKIPDDMEGILNTNKAAGLVSSVAGGLGFSQTDIRHGKIGALGKSSGVVKQAKMFDATLQYVDQNGKRPGAGAFYLEPWHIDVFDFCDLKKATGSDSQRARDNFYALWINDLFMKRIQEGGMWSLFCPKDTEDNNGNTLHNLFGKEFEERYIQLEKQELARKVVKAEELWYHILATQVETGGPFICYKDTVNYSNNQDFLGVIKQSNLCTEIVQYTDDNTAATCNLASITLKTFVKNRKRFDFAGLESACRQLVRNIDQVIDRTYIHDSLKKLIRDPNIRTRPMGIGVNGFANVLQLMKYSWSDDAAKQLNEDIFETMLYGCVNESIDLAIEKTPFIGWEKSPWGRGELPFDLYNKDMKRKVSEGHYIKNSYETWESSRYDWEKVRQRIKKFGLRNVFFLALMPTASSAHISGSNEAFEPWTQNCYLRSLLSGEFLVVNDLMVNDLIELGIWDERTQKHFKQNDGSIKELKIDTNVYSWWNKEKAREFKRLQEVYMTAFEIPMKDQIQMVSDRQKFVDQAQSFNFFCDNTAEKLDYNYITAFHFAGWKSGLKTGMYYFRGKPVTENMNQANRLDELSKKGKSEELSSKICVLDRDSGCISCQ